MMQTRKNGRRVWADVLGLILTLIMLVIVSAQFSVRSPLYSDTAYDLSGDWMTEDGQMIALHDVAPGTVTVTHSLSGMDLTDKSLCLKSSDTFLDISVDGETIYHYAPAYPQIIGRSYGNAIHMVSLPRNGKVLTMTLIPVYSGDVADLRAVAIEESSKFIIELYRQGLPEFLACLIMVIFGIIMMLLEIVGGNEAVRQPMGFLPLGLFSVIIGIWSMNDTFVLQCFTGRPEIIKMLCYLCMMLIAYPPVSFVASAAKRRDSKLLPVLGCLTVINFLSTLILSGLGIVDPHYMLLFSHFNIVAAMCMYSMHLPLLVSISRRSRWRRHWRSLRRARGRSLILSV